MIAPSGMPIPVLSHDCVCGHTHLRHSPRGGCKREDCDCTRFAPIDLPLPATLAADAYMIASAPHSGDPSWSFATDPGGWVSGVRLNTTDRCESLARIDAEIAALHAARAAFVAAAEVAP